jgi:hypothetical protein
MSDDDDVQLNFGNAPDPESFIKRAAPSSIPKPVKLKAPAAAAALPPPPIVPSKQVTKPSKVATTPVTVTVPAKKPKGSAIAAATAAVTGLPTPTPTPSVTIPKKVKDSGVNAEAAREDAAEKKEKRKWVKPENKALPTIHRMYIVRCFLVQAMW